MSETGGETTSPSNQTVVKSFDERIAEHTAQMGQNQGQPENGAKPKLKTEGQKLREAVEAGEKPPPLEEQLPKEPARPMMLRHNKFQHQEYDYRQRNAPKSERPRIIKAEPAKEVLRQPQSPSNAPETEPVHLADFKAEKEKSRTTSLSSQKPS